jgi:hypothetical protein
MALGNDRPMVLLPGMAADEQLFEPQRRAFPGLIVPSWIAPARREPLPSYARRMAFATRHGSADRTFPLWYTHPDEIVAGGGHLLTLTHPLEVNRFLTGVWSGLT